MRGGVLADTAPASRISHPHDFLTNERHFGMLHLDAIPPARRAKQLDEDDPLLLEAEPWFDQATMSFYPEYYQFAGPETQVPNLLFPMMLAKSWIARGDANEDRADSARLALASIEHKRGETEAARAHLARLRLSQMSEKEQQRAYQLLADTAESPLERLRWLAPLRGLAAAAGP